MEQRDPHGTADSEREMNGAKEHARNADYINPQELRVLQITSPGRDAYPGSRFTGTLITHHMERNPWHVPDAPDVGRNSKNYWT